MPKLSNRELEEKAREQCRHCAAGATVRLRHDTKEWVHDKIAWASGLRQGHTMCLAHDLRMENDNG